MLGLPRPLRQFGAEDIDRRLGGLQLRQDGGGLTARLQEGDEVRSAALEAEKLRLDGLKPLRISTARGLDMGADGPSENVHHGWGRGLVELANEGPLDPVARIAGSIAGRRLVLKERARLNGRALAATGGPGNP